MNNIDVLIQKAKELQAEQNKIVVVPKEIMDIKPEIVEAVEKQQEQFEFVTKKIASKGCEYKVVTEINNDRRMIAGLKFPEEAEDIELTKEVKNKVKEHMRKSFPVIKKYNIYPFAKKIMTVIEEVDK